MEPNGHIELRGTGRDWCVVARCEVNLPISKTISSIKCYPLFNLQHRGGGEGRLAPTRGVDDGVYVYCACPTTHRRLTCLFPVSLFSFSSFALALVGGCGLASFCVYI